MFDRLMTEGEEVAQRGVRAVRTRLSKAELPDGIAVTVSDAGIVLSGKGLRMRFVRDVRLRSFADLVRRILP